ncbi:MAG: membrane protein insertion efficiency factor YidD [Acidimicrobiales bacterium]
MRTSPAALPATGRRSGPVAALMILAIRAYQVARAGRPSMCRFTPSCSQYAVEAIERHRARRGLALTLRRLGRCRPGGSFGSDPVPE